MNHPYFQLKNESSDQEIYLFVKKKFSPALKRKLPKHYLVGQNRSLYLEFIRKNTKRFPFFLRLDIEKYFPSIDHQVLLKEIEVNYRKLTGRKPSRRFQQILLKDLPDFLEKSPYRGKGLPIGHALGSFLAGLYLLKPDLTLDRPFFRYVDDYLILVEDKKDAERVLTEQINPVLTGLKLSLNPKKVKSGQLHSDQMNFLGFDLLSGHFLIADEKEEKFRRKIIQLTHLTRNKEVPALIKQLDNQINGFGHYYKMASSRNKFQDLDSFIRQRTRRYLTRNKDQKNKSGNLVLTNQQLADLGLKSLISIKDKYDRKNKVILSKNKKKKKKVVSSFINKNDLIFLQNQEKYWVFLVLKRLDEMSKKLDRIDKALKHKDKK